MAYIKEAEGFLAKLPSISLEGMEPLAPQGPPKEQLHTVETQGYKGPQPGCYAFPGFEQQQAMAEQKNSNVPSNSQFSPNSTLFPLSSIESYDSGSVRSQAGLISNPMNDMSSCESDSMEDPSLRRSLRGAGRKSKPTKEKRKVGRPIAYCGDPNSPDLTPAERRRIKRRIANRESARRVRARRQDMIEEMAIKARQMEDQNMQLANHASAVEQQHAAMMAQLGDFNQRLQQTTVENEQLAKEISSLRNAVNSSMMPAQQPKEAVADHVQPTMPMPNSPVNHSSSGTMVYGNGASAYPSSSMPFQSQGLQSAPSFGNGMRSAFMQTASTALPDMPEASGPLFDIPKGFSKGFSLAPSMDQLMPNFDPLGMSLNDFLLGEAC